MQFHEAALALGSFNVRLGLAQDRVCVGLELAAMVTHLRGVLEEMDTEIKRGETALSKYAKEHGI